MSGETTSVSPAPERRYLIAQRLARAGGQDREHASARQERTKDFELVDTEVRMPEVLLEDQASRVESTAKADHPLQMWWSARLAPTPNPRPGTRLRVMSPLFLTTLMLVQTVAYPPAR